MNSNASGFLLNSPNPHTCYFQPTENEGIIDLGLSLRTVQQPDQVVYHHHHHPENLMSLEEYGGDHFMEWPNSNSLATRNSGRGYRKVATKNCDEESEGVQSKETGWSYVKVNMDGVIVGRKVCLIEFGGYPSLAFQLEKMFGKQSTSGLKLFQEDSEFRLYYMDWKENWRTVGDVPYEEFVENVKRLRIARKNEHHNSY